MPAACENDPLHLVTRAIAPITLPRSTAHGHVHVILAQHAPADVLDLGLTRCADGHQDGFALERDVVGKLVQALAVRVEPFRAALFVVHDPGRQTSLYIEFVR